jgi:murein DD-endopeptidase / murein LD-carboxypeptidase
MLKKALLYNFFIISLVSCASLKTVVSGKKEPVNEPVVLHEKKEVKFLNQESSPAMVSSPAIEKKKEETSIAVEQKTGKDNIYFSRSSVEKASPLQIKYSSLLNTDPGELKHTSMFEFIDEWYGTKYKLGGTSKKGIDCSAFSQYLFADVYGISLPRTAVEQYKMTDRISRTELREGDLIFFNTRGGVSHVGVYLMNNKFVHAAGSGGVMISDVFDQYWVRRFIAVGRLKEQSVTASGN